MIGTMSQIDWILENPDKKTSTIKYMNGTKIVVSSKEANKMAKILNKEKKEREKRGTNNK